MRIRILLQISDDDGAVGAAGGWRYSRRQQNGRRTSASRALLQKLIVLQKCSA